MNYPTISEAKQSLADGFCRSLGTTWQYRKYVALRTLGFGPARAWRLAS